jgi:hypothetical protein
MAHIHSMTAFHFNRRQLRRTAWATLVVWVLAMAAGVVNACALTPSGAAERAALQVGIMVHDGHVGAPSSSAIESHHEPTEAVGHHGHGQDSGKGSCLKFCDDESSAIAKVKLPVVDLSATLLTAAVPWSAIVAAGGAGFRHLLERPESQGPPLVIRFLRLTL